MVGITLSPDEIRGAPQEVRRWLEREIVAAFDLRPEPEPPHSGAEHLVACSREEAAAIYVAIRGVLPVVNVFFELGREGASVGKGDVEAYALADMLRHARLQNLEQLAACLQVLNEVARRIRGDANATLYLLDGRGGCLVATPTQRSILGVWRQVVAGQDVASADAAAGAAAAPSASAAAAVPRASIHMGDALGAAPPQAGPAPAAPPGARTDGAAQRF